MSESPINTDQEESVLFDNNLNRISLTSTYRTNVNGDEIDPTYTLSVSGYDSSSVSCSISISLTAEEVDQVIDGMHDHVYLPEESELSSEVVFNPWREGAYFTVFLFMVIITAHWLILYSDMHHYPQQGWALVGFTSLFIMSCVALLLHLMHLFDQIKKRKL